VSGKTCDDYTYKKASEPFDQCGSWKDGITKLFDKMKSWFHKSAASIKHLSGKVKDWADEYITAIDISDLAKTETEMLPKLAAVWGKFNDKQLAALKAAGKEAWGKILKDIDPYIKDVDVDALLKGDKKDILAKLSSAWEKFDENQLAKLKGASKDAWDKIIAKIPPEDLAALKKGIQDKLDVGKKIGDRLKSITLEDVATWSDKMWDKVPIDNLVFFAWSTLQKVPLAEIGKWTKEQWVKIPVDKLVRFTGDQIAKIDSASLAALSDKFWDKVPVYHITRFSVGLIQSAGLMTKLNATQMAYMTSEQWKGIPVESIVKFTVDEIQAIDYTALGAWSKEAWDKMPIAKIAAFVDQQIASVPPTVVGNWTMEMWLKFPTKEAIMFTGEQLAAGAKALKDLTVEQLSAYDWSQIKDDTFAKLPPELQEKITYLRKYATSFDTTKFKKKVARVDVAKKDTTAKLKTMQETEDNPKATADDKKKAVTAYHTAVAVEDKLEKEVEVERMEMYVVPAKASDTAGVRTTASAATVLLAIMWLQG